MLTIVRLDPTADFENIHNYLDEETFKYLIEEAYPRQMSYEQARINKLDQERENETHSERKARLASFKVAVSMHHRMGLELELLINKYEELKRLQANGEKL